VTTIKRLFIAMTALSLTLGAGASAAYAHGRDGDKASFPMKADEFQKRIDTRINKMRTHLEERLNEKQVPAEKAKEIRARFDAGAVKVNEATKQATSDGVVTEAEAKTVREAFRGMRHHHGRGHKKDGGKDGKKS